MRTWGTRDCCPQPEPDPIPRTLQAAPGYALSAGQRTRLENPYCGTPAEVLAGRRAAARDPGPALGLGAAALAIYRTLVTR